MNEQEHFWTELYAEDYIRKNSQFDKELGVQCWERMLASAEDFNSVLECGCNIGRNIEFLLSARPNLQISIIELSQPAFQIASQRFDLDCKFNGSIINSNFNKNFDLVFSIGVLIHVHPKDLLSNMSAMFSHSSRYILIGEYFSRNLVRLEYQGEANKLFKADYGKVFMENFNVKLVDYGFLWGHLYDEAGFDDITWWLFEKVI